MCDHCPIGTRHCAWKVGADRTPARQLEIDAQSSQLVADAVHDAVGVAGRTRNLEQLEEQSDEIVGVDLECLH